MFDHLEKDTTPKVKHHQRREKGLGRADKGQEQGHLNCRQGGVLSGDG